ncbi:EmrA/EmrK family multidrug efflux transporter periplasmic adaptor subunit [Trinickia dabaoshanensis]|uniref:EmrA/EmrK family multidrug efflux transporter periplasmic adaptor subunit n=1 Tax=Trinickia dabaoshanensis TaxID=564714 RepID=A0A2N7VFP2_9BURK|nr:HlyD family efflux transporter periplasmic adaptor subunit [Trinickia dabaoshanensis]PMS15968.1 EmrA/EmrK family multidrug efflux transporter periplasmic adaptor subunit [Trinickia dabaoshanensis]
MTVGATGNAAAALAERLARHRRLAFRWFALGLVIAAIAAGSGWWTLMRNVVSTDDAYVAGDVVEVSPRIEGTAVAVFVQDTDTVEAGAPLVRMDPTDARLSLDAAVEALAHAVRDYRSAGADADQAREQIRLRASELARAQDDFDRRGAIAAQGAVSKEELRHAGSAVAAAQAALESQRAAFRSSLAHIEGTTVASNPLVKEAAARVRSAALALARTVVRAPISGRITRRIVQVGQHVTPGTPLLVIVPLDRVWVDANFKESQLGRLHPGQAVTLTSDLYGGAVTYHGTIQGFEAGTGAAFAALPAQNATGNWIKVVQRVPVRIALDARELRANPLLIGMSMDAQVRVDRPGASHGALTSASASTAPGLRMPALPRTADTTYVYADDAKAGEALVDETIRANSARAGANDDKGRRQ